MSAELGSYSFLPWLRRGVANQIQAADRDPGVKVRASVQVRVEARGDKLGGGTDSVTIDRPVALFGPGDIVGIERRAICRLEPREGITNFEPNHLVHLEFYHEDMAWRYTPAAPDPTTGRLRPWIALIVLAEDEFTDGAALKDAPCPYIDVSNLSDFPAADELWAWAHVHVNRNLAEETQFFSKDMAATIPRLKAALGENPDLGVSRLISPRRLAPDTAYHAFVVPVFESGRRAGLGFDLGDVCATDSAWEAPGRPQGQSFPYYHRWRFRTGVAGDFETLVRLLTPKPVDPRVGSRDMDLQDPGMDVAPVDNPALGGVLRLGGALQPPAAVPPAPPTVQDLWDQPFPRPLQTDLAALLNLPDDYQAQGDPDPIITPPIYGRWHALTNRVLKAPDGSPVADTGNWIHRLNLDPRFRAPAGFGTRIIQENQEELMDAAWAQVGDVLEGRQRIRFGQFGLLTSKVWHERHLAAAANVNVQQAFQLMAPLARRVVVNGVTVRAAMQASPVQPAMTSAAFRRIARPGARLMRSLPIDDKAAPGALLERVNNGEVSAAPPREAPAGAMTSDKAAEALRPSGAPAPLLDLLREKPVLAGLPLLLAGLLALLLLLLLPLIGALIAGGAALAGGLFGTRLLRRWGRAATASAALPLDSQSVATIDALPQASGFRLSDPGDGTASAASAGSGADSGEAVRFKAALRDTFSLAQASAKAGMEPARTKLDLARVTNLGVQALAPGTTIARRVMATVSIPQRLIDGLAPRPAEAFIEPMAYPIIDRPMYEPLVDISSELFLPNINLIEENSITLLETNQRFIESYMVGLNHEFVRELLWREYPTDQRGTTFRQFWDTRSVLNTSNLSHDDFRESLRDIPALHLWPKASALGDHDHRQAGRANRNELVLVMRSELRKRYPTAVIYAHRACWQRGQLSAADDSQHPCQRSGPINNKVERRFTPLTATEEANPPHAKVLTPLYEAKVDPDIYFLGFDLTVEEAKGGTGEHPDDDPGWFFVIKECPGDPRFGLDAEPSPALQVWNDLSWPLVQPGPAAANIGLAAAPAMLDVANPGTADEKHPQYLEDKSIHWNRATMTSAELGYMLFQAPVLVGVHASEMLPK